MHTHGYTRSLLSVGKHQLFVVEINQAVYASIHHSVQGCCLLLAALTLSQQYHCFRTDRGSSLRLTRTWPVVYFGLRQISHQILKTS